MEILRKSAIGLGFLLLVVGCGGSGGAQSDQTRSVAFTIRWPETGRYLPPYANEVVVEITKDGAPVETITIPRPDSSVSSLTTTTRAKLTPGHYSALAQSFYIPPITPDATGGDVPNAKATLGFDMAADKDTNISLVLQSNIDRMWFDPSSVMVFAGGSKPLAEDLKAASPLDETILLPLSSFELPSSTNPFEWSIVECSDMVGGVCQVGTIDPNGRFHGNKGGSVVVRVREKGADKTASSLITVVEGG